MFMEHVDDSSSVGMFDKVCETPFQRPASGQTMIRLASPVHFMAHIAGVFQPSFQ